MIGGTSRFDIFGTRPAGAVDDAVPFIKALSREGFKVVFLHPGTKLPVDGRTVKQRKDDDAAAQLAAKEAGDYRWAETRTREGIDIATSDSKRLVAMYENIIKVHGSAPNFAIVPDGTFVIIDADQAASVEQFRAAYLAATGEEIWTTVDTPGVFGTEGPDGAWKHKGGGHFYLTLPEGYVLPEEARELTFGTGEMSWTLYPRNHYVVVPPSARPEGVYPWKGDVREIPTALLQLLEEDCARVAEARANRAERSRLRAEGIITQTGIDAWSEETPWRDLLEPDGWHFTRSRTSCGCPEVTAPGVHASPKSATAHEIGCRETDTAMGHGPLHVWTDNPPEGVSAYITNRGTKTMTKLQYVAWTRCDGDEGAAIQSLPITGGSSFGPVFDQRTAEALSASGFAPPAAESTPEPVPAPTPIKPEPEPEPDSESVIPKPFVYTGPTPPQWAKRKFSPNDRETYPAGEPFDPALMEAVFNHCDRCRAVFHHARNLKPVKVSPFSVLIRTLLRCGLRVPETMRLWDTGPITTFVAAVGRSGTGKSVAAAAESSPWADLPAPRYSQQASQRVIERKEQSKKPSSASAENNTQKVADSATVSPTGGANSVANSAANGCATGGAPDLGGIAGGVDDGSPILIPHNFDRPVNFGSGEGVSDALTVKVKVEDELLTEMAPWPVLLLDYDEFTNLLTVAKRDASTIISTYNAGWAGRTVGNSTRAHGSTETTGPYHLFLWGGLQPKLSGELLKTSDSGFLQRFIFTAVTDPYRFVGLPHVAAPQSIPTSLLPEVDANSRFTIDPVVDAEIEAANDDAAFDHLSTTEEEEASHQTQVKLRLAMLIALFHGSTHISEDIWNHAELLMEHSRRTLAWARVEAEVTKADEAAETGGRLAQVNAAKDSAVGDRTDEVLTDVMRHLKKASDGGLTRRELNQKLSRTKQPWLDRAITRLVTRGAITVVDGRYHVTAQSEAS